MVMIAVGMDEAVAQQNLRAAQATETEIDAVQPATSPTGNHGVAYELHSGALLIVDFARPNPVAHFKVQSLSLCGEPDVPKMQRVWTTPKEVTL